MLIELFYNLQSKYGSMRTFAELQRRRVKRNGLSCPPHPLQAVAYLVMLNQALVSATCIGPLIGDSLAVRYRQIGFGVVSGGLQVATMVLGGLLTLSDPTDPVVYAHRKALAER
jgi:hypothetical protein